MIINRRVFWVVLVWTVVLPSCASLHSGKYNVNQNTDGFMQSEVYLAVRRNRIVLSPKRNLEAQLMRGNTDYIVKNDFNLRSSTIKLPFNCTLCFEEGSFYNGTLVGDRTRVINKSSSQIFGPSMVLGGTWLTDTAHSNWFDIDSTNATGAVTWLIERAMEGASVTFDKKEYRVSLKYNDNTCYKGYRKSAFSARSTHLDLNFNGSTILDSANIESDTSVNFICLDNCSGCINGLYFSSVSMIDGDEKKYSSGKVVVHCINNCHDLSLQVTASHVRACVESGKFDWHAPSLKKSTIDVALKNGGYGVALYDGSDLNIKADVDYAIRGVYLGGCANSDVYVKCGRVSTGVACYMKDTRLIINDKKIFTQSNNLNVETYCYCYKGDTVNNVQFSSYDIQDFADRETPYISSINVKSTIRPVHDAANVRIFNIYGANKLDSLNANISFDLKITDKANLNKEVVLYNNSLTSDLPCEFYTNLSFTGRSSQPLMLKQEHTGGYTISLSNIEACVNNSSYKNGYLNLYLGASGCSVHNNKLCLSNCPVSYIRRSNSSLTYCYPVIYADSSSIVYTDDKIIADSIKLNSKREIRSKNPYAASVFSTLNVELDGRPKVLTLKNPNGTYYWASMGQTYTVVFSNISEVNVSKVTFDDTIIPLSREIQIPPSTVCRLDLIWNGEKFKVLRVY